MGPARKDSELKPAGQPVSIWAGLGAQRPSGSMRQPSPVPGTERDEADCGRQAPFGSIWQPSLLQKLVRKRQAGLKISSGSSAECAAGLGWAAGRPAAEAQRGVTMRRSRRRTVLRRNEALAIASPWRALHRDRRRARRKSEPKQTRNALRTTTAVRVDIAARVRGWSRKRLAGATRIDAAPRLQPRRRQRLSRLRRATAIRVDTAAFRAPEAPQAVPKLIEEIESRRLDDLRRPGALPSSKSGGTDSWRSQNHDKQEWDRLEA
jgi:hypothetical protein